MAGRLVYTKIVLAALPTYLMQIVLLPISNCKGLEKILRDLLWSHTQNSHVVNLVNWQTVCQPTSRGGLGLSCS